MRKDSIGRDPFHGGPWVSRRPRNGREGRVRMIANTDGGITPQTSSRPLSRRWARGPEGSADLVGSALERTRDWLLTRQAEEGYWVAELEGDTILESEYILLMTF